MIHSNYSIKLIFYIAIKRKAALFNNHGKCLKIIVTENEQFWKERAEQVASSNDHTALFKVNQKVYGFTEGSEHLLHAGYH